MKGLKKLPILLMGILTLMVTSCDFKIYKDLEPCNLYISYKYDYNTLSADAFTSKVRNVTLFIFDEEGNSVMTLEAEGNPFTEDFAHEVSLTPGTYQMVAWAGLDNQSYDLTGINSVASMKLAIKNNNGISDKELSHLWHSILMDVEVKGVPNERVVLPLIKDTNTFRIQILASDNSNVVDITDYEVSLHCDNGLMNGHNEVLSDHLIIYNPYLYQQMDVQEEGHTYYGGAVYEVRTGRLMAKANDRFIVVGKEDGVKTVLLDLKLQDLLASLRLSAYSIYPFQEYLDRQDEYVVSLIFGKNGDFASVRVLINGWLVREHSYEA